MFVRHFCKPLYFFHFFLGPGYFLGCRWSYALALSNILYGYQIPFLKHCVWNLAETQVDQTEHV